MKRKVFPSSIYMLFNLEFFCFFIFYFIILLINIIARNFFYIKYRAKKKMNAKIYEQGIFFIFILFCKIYQSLIKEEKRATKKFKKKINEIEFN